MAYIGREPQIGNFQICDAISTVNDQAAYTMQVSSVDVLPESANHMIVSLNGVIQKPNSSYTVSGATITFASNLVTGDVINFIQILGSVLDLGVPSDDTVTAAKLSSNAVTTAKILDANVTTAKIADANVTLAKLSATGTKNSTTFLRGDNTFNAPPLGGITEADMWRLSANITGDHEPLTSNLERVDSATFAKIGTGMSVSSGIWSFPITGLYQITFIWSIQATSSADNSMNGIIQGSSNNFTASDDLAQLKLAADTSNNKSQAATISAFFNCTNVSTHKIRFNINSMSSNTTRGNSGTNQTGFVFIRLGDSQ